MIRKLSAHYIYKGFNELLKFGIIYLDANGIITEIIDTRGTLKEQDNLEFYNGILIPAFPFINPNLYFNDTLLINSNDLSITDLKRNIQRSNYQFLLLDDIENISEQQIKILDELEKSGVKIVFRFPEVSLNFQIAMFKSIMQCFTDFYPDLFQFIRWFIINPAILLKNKEQVDEINVAMSTGINVLSGIDYKQFKLNKTSQLTVIA